MPTLPDKCTSFEKSDSMSPSPGAGSSVVHGNNISVEQNRVSSERQRVAQMERLLNTQPVDLDALFTVSRLPGGFLRNDLRKKIWPKFLGINRYDTPDFESFAEKEVPQQIRCDVERSFWSFNHSKDWSTEKLEEKRRLLGNIITAVLARNSDLYYYQGFHDVCVVFIEIFEDEPDLAFAIIETVSKHFLKDFMGSDFRTVTSILPLLLQIVKKVDIKFHAFLSKALTEPYFATSWLITWFSHDIKDLNSVARIFDGLLTSHPLFSLYVSVSVVLSCKDKISNMECEMSQIHNFLVNVCDKTNVSFDKIFLRADRLMQALPPDKLKKLASEDLCELIFKKEVALFLKPPCITRYCDTDAVLLEEVTRRKDMEVAVKKPHLQSSSSELTDTHALGDSDHAMWWLSGAIVSSITKIVDKILPASGNAVDSEREVRSEK